MNLTKCEPPSWLDRTAKEYWRRVAPSLPAGVLNGATLDMLACAASAYSTYREAQKQLKEQGRVVVTKSGTVKVNPWTQIEKQSFDTLARVFKELGIVEHASPDDDDLDQFMNEDECTNGPNESSGS